MITVPAGVITRGLRLWPFWLLVPALLVSTVLIGSGVVLVLYSLQPPGTGADLSNFSFSTWTSTLGDPFFLDILWRSVELSLWVTLFTLLVALPTALVLWKIRSRALFGCAIVLIASPLVISLVVRAYGWLLVLGDHGVINTALRDGGLINQPIHLIFNNTGVEISLVQAYLPLMVFPILASLRQIEAWVLDASSDLGAGAAQQFGRVIAPLALPGVVAGCQIVFLLTMSAFVTPEILGGGRVLVAAELVYDNINNINWAVASVQALTLITVSCLIVYLSNRLMRMTYLAHSRDR
jgi:putative spermidine/putrescine transport system permease protein